MRSWVRIPATMTGFLTLWGSYPVWKTDWSSIGKIGQVFVIEGEWINEFKSSIKRTTDGSSDCCRCRCCCSGVVWEKDVSCTTNNYFGGVGHSVFVRSLDLSLFLSLCRIPALTQIDSLPFSLTLQLTKYAFSIFLQFYLCNLSHWSLFPVSSQRFVEVCDWIETLDQILPR